MDQGGPANGRGDEQMGRRGSAEEEDDSVVGRSSTPSSAPNSRDRRQILKPGETANLNGFDSRSKVGHAHHRPAPKPSNSSGGEASWAVRRKKKDWRCPLIDSLGSIHPSPLLENDVPTATGSRIDDDEIVGRDAVHHQRAGATASFFPHSSPSHPRRSGASSLALALAAARLDSSSTCGPPTSRLLPSPHSGKHLRLDLDRSFTTAGHSQSTSGLSSSQSTSGLSSSLAHQLSTVSWS
jgi:hypothetical protein